MPSVIVVVVKYLSPIAVSAEALQMEVIRNNKGGQKLCLHGYMYVKKKSKNDWIRWQCSQQTSLKCKGAITTDANVSLSKVIQAAA